jgi:hypothetical protein
MRRIRPRAILVEFANIPGRPGLADFQSQLIH